MKNKPLHVLLLLAATTILSSATAQVPLLLNYHQIGVSTILTHAPSPDTLNEHVESLQLNKYHLSSSTRFINDLTTNGGRVALITFDDGFKSVLENAFPILNRNNVTATAFIIADKIGHPGYLTADDLKFLHEHGWEIGNHTLTHAALTDVRPSTIREEISRTNEIIESITGEKPTCVAYPYGLHDAVVREVVSELNDCAFTTAPYVATGSENERYSIPRPPLSGQDNNALRNGTRAPSIVMMTVGVSMLTWPLPDDAPISAPPSFWVPSEYRTLGDGRYKLNITPGGVQHELSVRHESMALHVLHGRGAQRAHAISLAHNHGPLTIAGSYVAGEGPGLALSYDLGNRAEPWAHYTLNGGLRAGVRFVPLDYTSVQLAWHHQQRNFAAEATFPIPILPGEGYPLRATIGYDQAAYASISFRAGGNALGVKASTSGTVGVTLNLRW